MERGKRKNNNLLKKNHKGLSTIVITLIIILISLVAVGIVWVVVRNVINTGTKEVTLGQFTLDAKIKDVNIDNSSNSVSLSVRRNAGIGEFSKMNFVFSDGKNSEVITQPVSLNELEEKRFTFYLSILNVSRLISISIVPYIKQDEKEILGNVLDKYTLGTQTTIPFICSPATCSGLGYLCGVWNNGSCSGSLNCGNCSSGYTCNAFGTCILGSCTPATCAGLGYQCGSGYTNGTCSGNLNCGNCTSGYNCNASGMCVPVSGPFCDPRTYYIDYVSGNDANNGTCSNSAWKRAPGMNGFTGTYSHQAGDKFIFKGGVTWPNSCFMMTISNSGSVGNVDYYGVNQAWYTGAVWTRPIFDAGGTVITGGSSNRFIYMYYTSYIQIDNIEFTGFYWNSTSQAWPNAIMIHAYGANYITWSNCYFHNWSHGVGASSENGYGIVGSTAEPNVGTIVENCTFDGSSTSDSLIGAVLGGIEVVRYSTFHNLLAGPITYGNTSAHKVYNNTVYNIEAPFDGSAHSDGIYFWGAGSVYNNIVHDVNYGMAIDSIPSWLGNNADVLLYNNIVWNFVAPGNGPITIANEVRNFSGTVRIFNNILEGGASATGPAIRITPDYMMNKVVIQNNHFITSYASPAILVQGNITYLTTDYQLLQTAAEATAEGYTSANLFAPTLGGSTINAGTNLSAYFTTDYRSVSRPQGSAWDIGAYEYV